MNSASAKQAHRSAKNNQETNQVSLGVKFNRLIFTLFGKVLPGLMSWWALKLWSRTRRFPASAREKRMQLRASECSLELNGKQIKAWRWGEGPTVLLVHGWNGRGLQLNRFIDPLLNAGYQVLCFDAPGHGQSNGRHTQLVEIRDTITSLSKQHGPFHAAIAHSFGVACLSAAINAGITIPNIISISSPGGLSQLIHRYCQYMHMPASTEKALRERLRKRLGDKLWQDFATSYPITQHSERSLIIHDKEDRLVNWQESEQLSKHWPNAEFILTVGLGHRRILFDPSIVNEVVEFIDTTMIGDPLHDDQGL